MKEFLIKNRILVLLASFFLIVLPVCFFCISYTSKGIKNKSQQIFDMKIDREVNQDFFGSLSALRANKNFIEENRPDRALLLSNEPQAKIRLFDQIEDLAWQAGHSSVLYEVLESSVPLRGASTKNAKAEVVIGAYKPEHISLKLSMTGTYENFLSFLHKIEHINYFNDVLDVSIVAQKTDSSERRLRFTNASKREEGGDQRPNLIDTQMTLVIYLDDLVAPEKDVDVDVEVEEVDAKKSETIDDSA